MKATLNLLRGLENNCVNVYCHPSHCTVTTFSFCLFEIRRNTSVFGLDHLIWFDHQTLFNKISLEALAVHGDELKSHMMRIFEIYIIAFALVFGGLSSTLTESDPAETGLDVSILVMAAVAATASFTGAGMALAGYNILSPIAEENIAVIVRSNQNFLRIIKFTWVGCIISYILVIGGLLYRKLEAERESPHAAVLGASIFGFFSLGLIQVQGYYSNVLARMALYSGALGVSTSNAIIVDKPDTEDSAISKVIELAYKHLDEEQLWKLYNSKISALEARKRAKRSRHRANIVDKYTPDEVEGKEMRDMKTTREGMDERDEANNENKKAHLGKGAMLGSIPNIRKHMTVDLSYLPRSVNNSNNISPLDVTDIDDIEATTEAKKVGE